MIASVASPSASIFPKQLLLKYGLEAARRDLKIGYIGIQFPTFYLLCRFIVSLTKIAKIAQFKSLFFAKKSFVFFLLCLTQPWLWAIKSEHSFVKIELTFANVSEIHFERFLGCQ